jgi:hypothetical protein
VDHIAREAEYIVRNLKKFNQGILDPIQDAIINENVLAADYEGAFPIHRVAA